MTTDTAITLSVQDRDVVVEGPQTLLHDRQARRFFGAILGGVSTSAGWRVPARSQRIDQLVLRVDGYISERGWTAERDNIVGREIGRAIERKRSYERTFAAAQEWKEGRSVVDEEQLKNTLTGFGWSDQRALRPHQLRDTLHGIVAGNSANFSVPGSGKTTTALAIAASRLAAGAADVVLVVGPLACFEPWEVESAAALPEQLRVRRVRGTQGARHRTYATAQPRTVLLTSYQSAAWDQQAIFDLADRLDVMLVVDESHRAKRFRGGTWAPALVAIARHCKARLILSGTPMPRSPLDLYSQLRILWPDGQLTGTADEFARRAEREFPNLRASIAPFTTRTAKPELGLPPFQVQRHDVELGDLEADVYDLIQSGLRRQLIDAPGWEAKIDALRRARPLRLLQAATNADLLNHRDDVLDVPGVPRTNLTLMDRLARFVDIGPPAKHAAAANLVADICGQGRKVVCWSNFIANLDQFRSYLDNRLGTPCYQIDGRVPVDDGSPGGMFDDLDETREQILDQFLSADGPAVLITNPASCSESISLHRACRDAIYLDRTYDAALYLQSIDRVHRLGMDPHAEVTIHLLLATSEGKSTIDHLVDESIQRKRDAMEQVLHGAELHPSVFEYATTEGTDDDLAFLVRHLLGGDVA